MPESCWSGMGTACSAVGRERSLMRGSISFVVIAPSGIPRPASRRTADGVSCPIVRMSAVRRPYLFRTVSLMRLTMFVRWLRDAASRRPRRETKSLPIFPPSLRRWPTVSDLSVVGRSLPVTAARNRGPFLRFEYSTPPPPLPPLFLSSLIPPTTTRKVPKKIQAAVASIRNRSGRRRTDDESE